MTENSLIPIVVEKSNSGERSYDIYSRLMRDRIVVLGEPVTDHLASRVVSSLLYLDSDKRSDIYLYINSPGGSVTAGLSIYDTMKALRSDVHTICLGQAASMGAFLLAGGTQGKRHALPHSRIMLHQVSSGTQGHVRDMQTAYEEAVRLNDLLTEILAKNTNQDLEKFKRDIDRDFFMSSREAKEYGVIDSVIEKLEYREENGD